MGVLNSNNKNCSQASLFGIFQLTMRFFRFIRFKIVVTEENTYFLASPPLHFNPPTTCFGLRVHKSPPPSPTPSPVCELQALKLKPSFFNKKKMLTNGMGGGTGGGPSPPKNQKNVQKIK